MHTDLYLRLRKWRFLRSSLSELSVCVPPGDFVGRKVESVGIRRPTVSVKLSADSGGSQEGERTRGRPQHPKSFRGSKEFWRRELLLESEEPLPTRRTELMKKRPFPEARSDVVYTFLVRRTAACWPTRRTGRTLEEWKKEHARAARNLDWRPNEDPRIAH